ncbi:hypothetical protein AB0G64_09310 [Streptomyces longwoodensis]|uniref:hypothetical protein n=1 Tax=Streptomyces longwoodensis TaxID=68231 RepID=UPI0034066C57
MSKSRSRKNRSARQKQRARQDAARAARAAAGMCPLYGLNLPYSGYREWLTPIDGAQLPEDTPQDLADFSKRLQRIAPLYGGTLPLAAFYLEQQISAGVLRLESTADPSVAFEVDLPDMATVLAETAPLVGDDLPPGDVDEDTGELLHQLHALGALVLDDRHVLRLSVQA